MGLAALRSSFPSLKAGLVPSDRMCVCVLSVEQWSKRQFAFLCRLKSLLVVVLNAPRIVSLQEHGQKLNNSKEQSLCISEVCANQSQMWLNCSVG